MSETVAVGSKAHLTSAKEKLAKARKAAHDADEDLKARHMRALCAFERDFERDTVGLRTALVALRRAAQEAEAEYDTAKIAAAQSSKTGHPIGTKLIEWGRGSYYGFSSAPRPLKPTGRVGIVQVWTRESASPAGMRWGFPDTGEKYVRVLKKDGTESRKFEKLGGWRDEWHPEGVTPEAGAAGERLNKALAE